MSVFLKLVLHHKGESEQQDGKFFPETIEDLKAVVVAGAVGFLEGRTKWGRAVSKGTKVLRGCSHSVFQSSVSQVPRRPEAELLWRCAGV